jgi:DNA-binding winged helix-turn-helix (wHTH) protein
MFGRVGVDADARRVSRAGEPVHLTRKALDLLLLLIEHRPNAVSKDDIYARVWPDSFVSESSLQSLIHEIRRAIDDPTAVDSWIRTVYGIGYRFDGDVVTSGAPVAAVALERPAAWLLAGSTRVALRPGQNIVGRGIDDVVEVEGPTISRHHARITIGAVATIEDLGSKNGTWLDDERVMASAVLTDGASVRLGSVTLTFRLARQPRPTESVREPAHDRRSES